MIFNCEFCHRPMVFMRDGYCMECRPESVTRHYTMYADEHIRTPMLVAIDALIDIEFNVPAYVNTTDTTQLL